MTIHNSLAELIGNTPLVKLNHIPQVAGIGTGGTISGTGKYLKEASNGAVKVIGSDPEGSIYSASSRDEVHQYDIEGVGGGGLLPQGLQPEHHRRHRARIRRRSL